MNCYETLFVVKPTLTEEEIKAQVEKIKAVLESEGAELVATDDMGMRKLAYSVNKNNRGYYTVFYYKAAGHSIAELERNLRINEEIIKFLTVKYTNQKEIKEFNRQIEKITKGSKETPAPSVAPVETTDSEEVVQETQEA